MRGACGQDRKARTSTRRLHTWEASRASARAASWSLTSMIHNPDRYAVPLTVASGAVVAGPCRELYVRAEGEDQSDWVTELQQPITR